MLTIVKTIKLLDDFHYNAFRDYVKNISLRSYYPLALIDVISRDMLIEEETDFLCKSVYNEVNDKNRKKLYQLAHYTFGLTTFLSKNYPHYLQHNLSRFQQLINTGALDHANRLATWLLEIAEKIEDYSTQVSILQVLAQQSILLESSRQATDYLQKAQTALAHQQTITALFERSYQSYHLKAKPTKVDSAETLTYFSDHFEHRSVMVQIISRYNYCFFLHYQKDNRFFTEPTYDLLNAIEAQLDKYSYLLLPYLVDFAHRVRYLKLRYQLYKVNIQEILEKSKELLRGNQDILYWNSYINPAELVIINAQANFFISNYMTAYRRDEPTAMPEVIREQLEDLMQECERILDNTTLEEHFTIRYINLTTIYAVLLLVDGTKQALKKAIELLQQTLITYQQVSFQAYADAIYSTIGTAYFCLEDYKNVENNYLRYRKATKKKDINPHNDVTIHGFYYAAKWLETGREQYPRKLRQLIAEAQSDRFRSIKNTLEELVAYYKMP